MIWEPTIFRRPRTALERSGSAVSIISDASGTVEITTSGILSPSFVLTKGGTNTESIQTITLDQFVEENKITKVDFIKSDVEGAERNLLRGSVEVLRTFAPKLSICTYHLPDDPEVLAKIIIEANPKYKIVQLKSKLYAST